MSLKNMYAKFKRDISGPNYEWQVGKGQYPVGKFQLSLKGRTTKNYLEVGSKIRSAEYMVNVENKADATKRKVQKNRTILLGKFKGK